MRCIDGDHRAQRLDLALEPGKRRSEVGAREAELGTRVVDDELELLPMQPEIDRHGGEARVPGREQHEQEFRAVAHRERDARARQQAHLAAQRVASRATLLPSAA